MSNISERAADPAWMARQLGLPVEEQPDPSMPARTIFTERTPQGGVVRLAKEPPGKYALYHHGVCVWREQ